MKILFAVNNDNVSEAIVKKYQKEYKEILSYKNVYYFNAIYRELQKDKSYSRIVISEDLEPFANNNYNSIDKFLFEKYTNIIEELKNSPNSKIDIILICADRRKKTDDMLAKLYKNGIYNAIIGQDRSIDEVCRLINHPRDKEEAKKYYNIYESELENTDTENSVSEAEIENIRAHYARLGKNEDKYIDSFNNIVAQYTDTQLRIIIKYLPMNVKAVLEEKSQKYQQLVMTSAIDGIDAKKQTEDYKQTIKSKQQDEETDIVEQLIKPKKFKSVVIPTNINAKNVQKVAVPKVEKPEMIQEDKIIEEVIQEPKAEEIKVPEIEKPKRGRGRPRKNPLPEEQEEPKAKRGRGRPRKQVEVDKAVAKEDDVNLFEMEQPIEEQKVNEEVDLFNIENEEPKQETKPAEPEINLFDLTEESEKVDLVEEPEEVDLFNISNEKSEEPEIIKPEQDEMRYDITKTNNTNSNFNTLLTGDKKIVAFVGTTKNGTSFVVNNTAEMLSSMGIKTAILDMTKTKNAYYIYTNNEESLRIIAKNCMEKLQNGIPEGITVNKNLTVYTEMPGEEKNVDVEKSLSTLLTNYSAILIDTDFETDLEIFEKVQELYLVQSMDVLTIQPLTAFLRNLKSKEILKPERLRIVINKSERIRSLNIKTLIGGMSCYNSPNMTYMTELFNKDNIRYCEIPFETQNYVKYLDSLVNCSISLNGYTKQFIMAIKELANMVYPLLGKQAYPTSYGNKERDPFSSQVNDTLNKMRKKY